MVMYRQGDVLAVSVEAIPGSAVRQDRCILALGEVTGHAHQILHGATLYIDTAGDRFFEVDRPTHAGGFEATLLDDDDQSFLVGSALGTIRFAKTFAQYIDGRVHCEPFALLEHEEHHFHAYGKGAYRHIQQREYAPGEIRNVAD